MYYDVEGIEGVIVVVLYIDRWLPDALKSAQYAL